MRQSLWWFEASTRVSIQSQEDNASSAHCTICCKNPQERFKLAPTLPLR